ncbi:MAG TPA: alpha/beta hydrolase [Polyangiaceae bacterium]
MVTGWVFLAIAALALLAACNTLRPLYAPAMLATFSFFAGWLVGELAPQAVVALVVCATVFWKLGALASRPGQIALAVTFGACAVLLMAQGRARRARACFDLALREAFGQALPGEASRAWLAPAFDWLRVALPFPVRHPAVACDRRVEFHREGDVSLRLDVHRARGHRGRGPTLVYVHGGAWILGHRERQGLPLLQHLAARGWVCFSVDYRLSPRATFPDHLIDVKRAVAWVRAHASRYGADPGFLVIAGNSAGAHLASLVALTPGDPEYQPGFERDDTSVAACIGFYGIYDLLDRHRHWPHGGMKRLLERHVMKVTREDAPLAYERASPVTRVCACAPPFLLVHGACDSLAPVAEARRFHQALRESADAPVAYAELPGAQHAFELFPSVRTAHVLDGVTRFLAFVHGRHVARLTPRIDARSSEPRPATRSARA